MNLCIRMAISSPRIEINATHGLDLFEKVGVMVSQSTKRRDRPPSSGTWDLFMSSGDPLQAPVNNRRFCGPRYRCTNTQGELAFAPSPISCQRLNWRKFRSFPMNQPRIRTRMCYKSHQYLTHKWKSIKCRIDRGTFWCRTNWYLSGTARYQP